MTDRCLICNRNLEGSAEAVPYLNELACAECLKEELIECGCTMNAETCRLAVPVVNDLSPICKVSGNECPHVLVYELVEVHYVRRT